MVDQATADLSGKVAWVTGASRGIGRAIALQLVQAGATVIGTATSEAGASAISDTLSSVGGSGEGKCLNVCNPEDIGECLQQISDKWGAPAILVNNAAITRDGLLLRMREDDWRAVLETNLSAVYHTCKAVLRGMTKARWGRIVSISSVVARKGNPGQVNYCASKAGVEGMTRSLAYEMAPRGITVNAVAPGFIETDMTDSLTNEQKEIILKEVPLGRLGEPSEVASAVCFLASDQARYITGQTLAVNGGLSML